MNDCLDECDYFIVLFAGTETNWSSTNYCTIYLNGLPILSDIYITNDQRSQRFSFGTKVKSTDVITVERAFQFYGGMAYGVYRGNVLMYMLGNNDSAPPDFQYITNYCGLNANLAVRTTTQFSAPGTVIPVTIMKYIPESDFPVKIFLICGSQVQTLIRNTMTPFDFLIPPNFSGNCYFYSSVVNYNSYLFLNSANLPIFVGQAISPFAGELIYIPPEQTVLVARSLSMVGSMFTTFQF